MESSLPGGGYRGEESQPALPFPFRRALGTVLPEGWILRTTPLEALLEVDISCLSQTLLALLGGQSLGVHWTAARDREKNG